ncbi:MAG: DMT family transporter [Anaerolineae bacterium]
MERPSAHVRAVLQALFVTFLWSTSWVLVKIGLEGIPALVFAGLRYVLAFFCLLLFAVRSGQLAGGGSLSPRVWGRLSVLGVLFYSVTQGAVYVGLTYLPAMTTSLLLSFTPIVVALLGLVLLKERPTTMQWCGMSLYLVGVALYFTPIAMPRREIIGLVVVSVAVLANALSSILGRYVNRDGELDPMTVTVVSMGSGGILLFLGGLIAHGFPRLTLMQWAIILWLAVVNSALAFTLWNATLRILSATESSIINNTMLFQIAVLAWVFLGERPSGRALLGMLVAAAGTVAVQVRRR